MQLGPMSLLLLSLIIFLNLITFSDMVYHDSSHVSANLSATMPSVFTEQDDNNVSEASQSSSVIAVMDMIAQMERQQHEHHRRLQERQDEHERRRQERQDEHERRQQEHDRLQQELQTAMFGQMQSQQQEHRDEQHRLQQGQLELQGILNTLVQHLQPLQQQVIQTQQNQQLLAEAVAATANVSAAKEEHTRTPISEAAVTAVAAGSGTFIDPTGSMHRPPRRDDDRDDDRRHNRLPHDDNGRGGSRNGNTNATGNGLPQRPNDEDPFESDPDVVDSGYTQGLPRRVEGEVEISWLPTVANLSLWKQDFERLVIAASGQGRTRIRPWVQQI